MPQVRHSKRSLKTWVTGGWWLVAGGWSAGRRELDGPRGAAALEIRGLDRIGQSLTDAFRVELQPIDNHLEHRPVRQRGGIDVVEGHDPGAGGVHEQSAEAPASQRLDGLGDGGGAGAGRGLHLGRDLAGLALFLQFVDVAFGRLCLRGDARHDRQVEADEQARAGRPLAQLSRHHLRRLAHDFAPALPAERPPDPRVQEPHVVVNLCRRADGGARIADAVFLADRDGRRDPVDAIDVGLLHALEELARVRRQRFHVPPLPFRIDRVEGERRLARPAHARHDDELAERQR